MKIVRNVHRIDFELGVAFVLQAYDCQQATIIYLCRLCAKYWRVMEGRFSSFFFLGLVHWERHVTATTTVRHGTAQSRGRLMWSDGLGRSRKGYKKRWTGKVWKSMEARREIKILRGMSRECAMEKIACSRSMSRSGCIYHVI